MWSRVAFVAMIPRSYGEMSARHCRHCWNKGTLKQALPWLCCQKRGAGNAAGFISRMEALNALFPNHARAAGLRQGMCLQSSLWTDKFRIACRAEYRKNACGVLSRQRFNRDFRRSRRRPGGGCETGGQYSERPVCATRDQAGNGCFMGKTLLSVGEG